MGSNAETTAPAARHPGSPAMRSSSATAARFLLLIKPTRAALGYALFLAINAASVWGGVFPFMPMEYQESGMLFWFFLAQSSVFAIAFLVSVFVSYRLPRVSTKFPVGLVSTPYALGWACLIASMYLHDWAPVLTVCAGGCLGVGSAGFYMLWQRIFASAPAERGNRNVICGTAWAAVIYLALYAIPRAVTMFLALLVFLPLFALVIQLETREIDLEQPMYQDVPYEHPRVYRKVVSDVWRSALCMGSIGLCTGIMRALAIPDPSIGSLVNVLSMIALLIAAIALLAAWAKSNVTFNIPSAYRAAFPLVVTAFALLPLFSEGYLRGMASALYGLHNIALLFMMMQCAQISRDRGVSPVFIYGVFGGVMYALHDIGFVGGSVASQAMVTGVSSKALIALAALYVLSMMYYFGVTRFHRSTAAGDDSNGGSTGNTVELIAPVEPQAARAAVEGTAAEAPDEEGNGASGNTTESAASAVAENPNKAGNERAASANDRRSDRANGQRSTSADDERDAETDATRMSATDDRASSSEAPRRALAPDAIFQDRTSLQVEVLKRTYGLSSREAEVAERLVRGDTVARIAEELVISENTVRTHSKRLYAKLDVHKKQELRDLVESLDPGDLER